MSSARSSTFKHDLFGQFALVGKALSSGPRLEMLELLAQKERSVDELARLAGLSVANASQHLKVLRGAGLVETRKEGLYVYCRLSGDEVFALWQALRRVGERRNAEVDRLVRSCLSDRASLEAVSLGDLRQKLVSGHVVVLDVRPPDEFAAGHIPGARNIPLAELERRLRGLPKDRDIVAYCRGPYCVLSDDAVALLRSKGRRAFRLEEGYPDWQAMGWPCERPATRSGAGA